MFAKLVYKLVCILHRILVHFGYTIVNTHDHLQVQRRLRDRRVYILRLRKWRHADRQRTDALLAEIHDLNARITEMEDEITANNHAATALDGEIRRVLDLPAFDPDETDPVGEDIAAEMRAWLNEATHNPVRPPTGDPQNGIVRTVLSFAPAQERNVL